METETRFIARVYSHLPLVPQLAERYRLSYLSQMRAQSYAALRNAFAEQAAEIRHFRDSRGGVARQFSLSSGFRKAYAIGARAVEGVWATQRYADGRKEMSMPYFKRGCC
jgi:hypothetical protein